MQNVDVFPGTASFVSKPARTASVPTVSRAHLAEGLVERDGVLSGSIPAWLDGRLLRTAPAVFESGTFRVQHWFDALGLLYGFRFREGSVSFAQRLLESETAAEARRGGVPRASFGSLNQRGFLRRVFEPVPAVTDNANVNILRVGDEWIAMTESPHHLRVDDAALEVRGRVAFDDALPKALSMTAHPHFDFERKRVVNIGTGLGQKGEIIAFEHAPGSATRHEIGRFSAGEVPYVHSFGMTSDAVIVVGQPWLVRPWTLLWSNRGFRDHVRWRPELGTRFIVFDRRGGARREFEAEPFFTFHTVNSYADGDELVVDLLAYSDPGVIEQFSTERMLEGLEFERPKLVRAHLERSGRARLETLSDVGFEFPSINYRRANGSRHRYVWGATAAGDGQDVVGIDCESGVVRRFGVPGYVFGEPVFVPAPSGPSEDDGVLLVVGSNGENSKLAVLDAHSLEARALLHLDLPIPLGFHGSFSRA